MSSHFLLAAGAEIPNPDAHSQSGDAVLPMCESTVADAFLLLATSTAEDAVRRVRKLESKADPEVLHKLRVAFRRLRSLWWAYGPLLDRKDARFRCGEFKSLANAAGKTRDWDVLRDLLDADPSTKHSIKPLIELVDERRTEALSFSRRTIGNAGVERVLEQACTGARTQLESRARGLVLVEFAEDRVSVAEKALKKRVRRAASQSGSDYAALHEVRIAGKKLRYLLEFFSPVLGGGHWAVIERLTSVQDELGRLNDLVTSEALLREYMFQLGEPCLVEEAIGYLQDQKGYHMGKAQEILRAQW
ncbi:CHAD domain-containing protein [Paraburkholderia sp. GAS42]|uniref:CHAD domain-containing protein n=1 Tax=Paraburkholderia sp. GAS42 TaxID=3035135 RepID=UPI003D19C0AB